MIRPLAIMICGALLAAPATAQQYVRLGSDRDDSLRLRELMDTVSRAPLVLRSPSALAALASAAPAPRPRLDWIDAEWRSIYDSRYPRSLTDGVLWAGRGVSFALSAGARVRWGPLSAVLDPTFAYAQNRSFDLAPETGRGINRGGLSPFAYAYQQGHIDWPERFGDQAFGVLDWGQSGIRVTLHPITVGLSSENMWWGPAMQNPNIMSNAGPGFPHLDLGTATPVSVGIGRLEARFLWGRLTESAYFDTVASNDHRLFAGFLVGFRPRGISGLTLGAGRVFYQTWDSLGVSDFLDVFQTVLKVSLADSANPLGNDRRDQMLSLIARWTFPEVGFDAYVEWARNDHNWDFRDFVIQPDHSRAFTLGFQHLLPGRGARVRLRGEVTTLGRPSTILVRGTPTYYVHHIVRQGYTHRGQLIGAPIGPGSQSQWLALDRYSPRGRLGLAFQRVRFDDDAYYRSFAGPNLFRGQQTELTGTLSGSRSLGPLGLSAALALSRELNRHYEVLDDVTNVMLDLRVTWRLAGRH
jgi:hypothetical protein